MDVDEALGLISSGEGQNIEFKTSFSEENAAIESLGAFANAQGGTVLIGVKNDSTVCGVNIGANTLENFANNTRTASQPPLYPSIVLIEIDGNTVAAITIAAAEQSQLVYVFNTPRIRVGRSNQVMSPDEQRRRLLEGKESDVPGAVDTAFHELQSASYLIGNETFSALQVFERVGHELLPGRDAFIFRAYVAQAFNLSPSNLVDEKPILQHWMLIGIVDTPERVQPVPRSGPDSNVRRPEQPYDRYSLSALGKKVLNEMRNGTTPSGATEGADVQRVIEVLDTQRLDASSEAWGSVLLRSAHLFTRGFTPFDKIDDLNEEERSRFLSELSIQGVLIREHRAGPARSTKSAYELRHDAYYLAELGMRVVRALRERSE